MPLDLYALPTLANPKKVGQTARAIRDHWRDTVPVAMPDPAPPVRVKPGTRREYTPRGEGPRKRWAAT